MAKYSLTCKSTLTDKVYIKTFKSRKECQRWQRNNYIQYSW